jgi:elongation factor Ts
MSLTMTGISTDLVKQLRDKTGAGMMDCKRALEETGGDMEKAIEYLRKKGAATAAKRADKAGGRIGAMVELNCETDFVAKTPEFKQLAHDIAMQIAAMNPHYISREQVEQTVVAKELEIYKSQAANEGKPEHIAEKIAQGRLEKYFQEVCLLGRVLLRIPARRSRTFSMSRPERLARESWSAA